jgi:hypothetical protein
MTKEQIENYFCKTFSVFGYCPNSKLCPKSHDVEDILRLEFIKKEKKNLKKNKNNVDNQDESVYVNVSNENKSNRIHNSGYDAFMTGASFLCFLNKFNNFRSNDKKSKSNNNTDFFILDDFDDVNQFNFKIYLTGKDYPLLVQKSSFSKTSSHHQEKRLRNSKQNI